MQCDAAVPGAADDGQGAASEVRRFGRSVGRLHAVLSGCAVAGLLVFVCHHAPPEPPRAGLGSRGAAAAESFGAAVADGGPAAIKSGGTGAGYSGAAGGFGWAAVFSVVHLEPAVAILVCRARRGAISVPAVCAFECGIARGSAGLPGSN